MFSAALVDRIDEEPFWLRDRDFGDETTGDEALSVLNGLEKLPAVGEG